MYNLDLNGHDGEYELRELIKMWPPEYTDNVNIKIPFAEMERNATKRYVFELLYELSGYAPEWGILTGVRPVKLVNEMINSGKSIDEVKSILSETYKINESKISLLIKTSENQHYIVDADSEKKAGLYIGIPFCPTRCVYCSFTSNQVNESEMKRYLDALSEEMSFTGKAMNDKGINAESIYIGGGTPTSLPPSMLETLMKEISEKIDLTEVREFCVEAGRPDTIDDERMSILREYGVGRISINPQSMNSRTLGLIGRDHTPEDVRSAFETARKHGFDLINSDIIAGLPEETIDDFLFTLNEVIKLGAANITVHTLAVKRASKLKEIDENYHYEHASDVGIMVDSAREILDSNSYEPYYLYRQKHMTGNYENVGYTKEGCASIYNVRIMDEHQTIIALGAGGISKAYYPETNRLQRVPNVSNYSIYIDRIGEMIQRKKDKLFI